MSTPRLVTAFYERIWNDGEIDAVSDLLSPDVIFRGSLGAEVRGHSSFQRYVEGVREVLSGYRCEVLACVAEGDHAFAKMRFSGLHVGLLRGYRPTGLNVRWIGAALFQFEQGRITEVWVLGDLAGLDEVLKANAGLQAAAVGGEESL